MITKQNIEAIALKVMQEIKSKLSDIYISINVV